MSLSLQPGRVSGEPRRAPERLWRPWLWSLAWEPRREPSLGASTLSSGERWSVYREPRLRA
eukprot:4331977-Alexandrium_andersonii.AAC.1